jgi:hypothetical protein
MTHFQFIVLVCAGMITILAAVSIIVGAIMKKDSGEIKKPCAEKFAAVKEEQTDKFEKIERCLSEIEGGAKARNDRILILETRFTEIISTSIWPSVRQTAIRPNSLLLCRDCLRVPAFVYKGQPSMANRAQNRERFPGA